MEREGYVSLWIGNSKSDEELLEYVELYIQCIVDNRHHTTYNKDK